MRAKATGSSATSRQRRRSRSSTAGMWAGLPPPSMHTSRPPASAAPRSSINSRMADRPPSRSPNRENFNRNAPDMDIATDSITVSSFTIHSRTMLCYTPDTNRDCAVAPAGRKFRAPSQIMLKRLIADLGWLRFLLVCVTLLVIACAPLADMRLQHGWHLWPSVIAPTFMAMLAFSLPLDITMAPAAVGLYYCGAARALAPPAGAIVQSPHDQRQYEYLVLPNKMRVLLISDAGADHAAAALEVGIGSSSDPADRLGLAHFLEHMLFLGTQKYPQPGEYQDFITAHGGNHNAFTGYEETNFHFDIDKRFLEPALDRFSQFFIAPLFTAEYVAREKNAVDSEYQARITEDERRSYSVLQQLLNPAHPMSRFTVGSLATLADRDGRPVRDELLRFYQEHYSANLMTLTVLGVEPLPVLRRWVTEKFGAVRNTDAKPRQVNVPPVLAGRLPVRVNIEPVKDERELQLIFPLPPVRSHYREKPLHYIGNLLGHEGTGSLLSLLKKRGWGEQLSAGTVVDDTTESAFAISIKLTETGLQHVDDVVGLVFQDIALLRAHGVEAWRYREQARLADISFEFRQNPPPLETVIELAAELQRVAVRDVLRADYLMENYDEPLIRAYLDKLTPENVIIAVLAHGVKTDREDPWYHAAYQVQHLSPRELSAWRSPSSVDAALVLPEKNPFIPENTAVLPLAADATPVPVRIDEQPGFELWFKQDDTFRLPIADFYFSVRSPVANDSAAHSALTALYTRLISDQLNEYAYPAQLAGLSYKIYPHVRGFTVRISGYNDKQSLLLEQIARTLREPRIVDERFAEIKDVYLRELANVRHEDPYEQTTAEISKLLVRPSWSEEERMRAAEPLTAADLRTFIP